MSLINGPQRSGTISNFYSPQIADIGVDCSNGVAVVTVTGELDVSNTPWLYECLQQAIDAGMSEVMLDVEHLTFLGSSGLSVILGAHKRMRARGGTLTVVAPSPFVERLFHLVDDIPQLMIQRRGVA
jgi:anti-anti-sigma factor